MDRFLVIDDSSTIQKVVELAFAPYSVSIIPAASYLEAINVVNQDKIDLVIADASLPGIKGARDYADLQNQFDGVPFIILLGSYDGVDQASFHQYGFKSFLPKPFEAADLIAGASQALGREIGNKAAKSSPPPPPASTPQTAVLPDTKPSTKIFPKTEPSSRKDQSYDSEPEPPPVSSMSRLDISDVDVGDFSAPFTDPVVSDIGKLVPQAEDERDYDDERYAAAELTNHLYDDDGVYESDNDRDSSDFGEFSVNDDEPTGTGIDLPAAADPSAKVPLSKNVASPPPPPTPMPVNSTAAEMAEAEVSSSQAGISTELNRSMLEAETTKIIEKTVLDYCESHFGDIARKLIKEEIDLLLKEKSRLLIDND